MQNVSINITGHARLYAKHNRKVTFSRLRAMISHRWQTMLLLLSTMCFTSGCGLSILAIVQSIASLLSGITSVYAVLAGGETAYEDEAYLDEYGYWPQDDDLDIGLVNDNYFDPSIIGSDDLPPLDRIPPDSLPEHWDNVSIIDFLNNPVASAVRTGFPISLILGAALLWSMNQS